MTKTRRGDALLKNIAGGADREDGSANEMVEEFFLHDYPVDALVPLLRSEDLQVVRSGAFIVQELAGRAAPLMAEIGRLLAYDDGWVKSDMLSAMMSASTPSDGEAIAAAIMLVDDDIRAIRASAWLFLAAADRPRAAAALPGLSDGPIFAGVAWLVEDRSDEQTRSGIAQRLADGDRLTRGFGAVAAAWTIDQNRDLLERAAESEDDELKRLARSVLDRRTRAERRKSRKQRNQDR